mmetsp:Transcript_22653/g.37432  ORF Transcript_22653/g.37432 Transcript_22653/m.37432 type:complete len:645 (-) Transcript_22653:105-2039(-)
MLLLIPLAMSATCEWWCKWPCTQLNGATEVECDTCEKDSGCHADAVGFGAQQESMEDYTIWKDTKRPPATPSTSPCSLSGVTPSPTTPPSSLSASPSPHTHASPTCDAAEAEAPAVLALPDIAPKLRSDDALRLRKWKNLGEEHYDGGRLGLAVQHFVMAVHVTSWVGALWGDLGLVLTDLAKEASTLERLPLLCEAWIAIELGVALGAERKSAGLDHSLVHLSAAAGCPVADDERWSAALPSEAQRCIEAACEGWLGGAAARSRYSTARRVLAQSRDTNKGTSHERHKEAVQQLCVPAEKERVTVVLRSYERERQVLGAVSAYQAWALFRYCGVVALRGVLNSRDVDRALNASQAQIQKELPTIMRYREDRKRFGARKLKTERLTSQDESDLRYEIKLNLAETDPYLRSLHHNTQDSKGEKVGGKEVSGGIVDNEMVLALSKLLLHSNAMAIDTMSTVFSFPNCPRGRWHQDIVDPREHASTLLGDAPLVLPPGLVLVVPLVNLTKDNGLMEFRLGSHDTRGSAEDDETSEVKLDVALAAEVGSVTLFDLRIQHRGGANHSPESHPILYVEYCVPWFRNEINLKDRHTASWDAHPSLTRRALLARLDTLAYTRLLEEELQLRSFDIAALRSLYADYEARSLVV